MLLSDASATETAKLPTEQTDDEILAEIIEQCGYMLQQWGSIREQGNLNMQALSIDGPIPPALRAERTKKENPRPCGHTDIISFANNRVVNQWRMNPRGVQVNQTGSGATKESAELRESRLREIAYSSQAKSARLNAFQNAVDRGYGHWEVYLEYESPRSSKQKICIGRIPNPNSVLIDPDTTKADRSDMKMAAKMGRKMRVEEFRRKYPNARDISSFPSDVLGLAHQFVSSDGKYVTPAEYWRVVTEEHTLLTLENGDDVFADEVRVEGETVATSDGSGLRIVKRRQSETAKVEHFVTNGLQILSRDIWPDSEIPIITAVAREKYVDDELTIEALTAKAREPQLNFDIARMDEVEGIMMTPKSKWVVSDEQIAGYENIYKNAHRDPTAYLPYHAYDSQHRPTVPPERTDFQPPVQALEMAANSFLRDAQNTLGMTTIERIDKVSKSGVAQQELNESQDIGTFHLTDNMIIAVEREGRICNRLLAVVEDSKRTVGLREASGKYKTREIEPVEENGRITHPYGEGESHDVTISTGPDYQSQHMEKVEFLANIAKTPDFLANPLAPMIIHEAEIGPGGDKMEKIALSVQPPAVQAAYAEEDEGAQPLPPAAIQKIQQKDQELQALNEHAKTLETQVIELQDDIKAQVIQSASKENISDADNATKVELERMKEDHDYRMAQLDLEMKKLELEREKIRGEIQLSMQARSQSHESAESQRDRQSAADLAARKEVENIG